MVASEHPDVIEGRLWLIVTNGLEFEDTAQDDSIDTADDASDEEDESGPGEAGVRRGVTKSITEEVEEVQRVVKYSSLLSYMLKPPSLLKQ